VLKALREQVLEVDAVTMKRENGRRCREEKKENSYEEDRKKEEPKEEGVSS